MHTYVNGEGFVSATFSLVGLRRRPTITCGVVGSITIGSVTGLIANWRDSLIQSSRPYLPGNMAVGWSLVQLDALFMSGGTLHQATDRTLHAGTSTTIDCPPPNGACVIAKPTGVSGRKFRGRMFAPLACIDESLVDMNGNFGTTAMSALNSEWNGCWGDLDTAGYTPVILHDDAVGGGHTVTTGFSPTQLIGTTRRRIR